MKEFIRLAPAGDSGILSRRHELSPERAERPPVQPDSTIIWGTHPKHPEWIKRMPMISD